MDLPTVQDYTVSAFVKSVSGRGTPSLPCQKTRCVAAQRVFYLYVLFRYR